MASREAIQTIGNHLHSGVSCRKVSASDGHGFCTRCLEIQVLGAHVSSPACLGCEGILQVQRCSLYRRVLRCGTSGLGWSGL
eukprot:6474348-Amphidinium_carterae.2